MKNSKKHNEWEENNSEKVREYKRQWKKRNPDKVKAGWEKYYAKNEKKIKQKRKKHYLKNKERVGKQSKEWRENNKEKVKEIGRIYREKNKEERKVYNRKWIENNREMKVAQVKRRRAKVRGAEGTHTFGEWQTLKAQYNWTCLACKKREPKIVLTEDHIIPLSKGGSNNIENIQPLCRSCNSKKYTKIIKYIYD